MLRWSRALLILRAVALLAAYLGLMAWLTWPLATVVWSSMPFTRSTCLYDMYYSAWVLAHESRALVSPATRFADGNIFHPASNTKFYG